MYQHSVNLSDLDKPEYFYVQTDYDLEFWLEFVAFPTDDQDDITGMIVITNDGDLIAMWLSESSRPYDLNSTYHALPYYRPEKWDTKNLPSYWIESNKYYNGWQFWL